jgi:rhodanese-related sulfurtransferase
VAESEKRLGVDDVEAGEVWERLAADSGAQLVDVRTQAEWAFVGVPDLTAIGKQTLMVEWMGFPDNQRNPSFADQLALALDALGTDQDADLYFICRSGVRSLAAAQAMVMAGYRACHNVAGGFEGPPDNDRHRGILAGWKVVGLPWLQG